MPATVSWLVRDTFRQSLASGICWLLFGLSTVCILVCLSASVSGPAAAGPGGREPRFPAALRPDAHDAHKLQQSGVAVADGTLRLAFGAIRVPVARDARSAVHFLQLILAGGVADTLGLLLTLVWTAGFLPGFLDPRAVSVLLAKPVPRWGCCWASTSGVLGLRAGPGRLLRRRHLAGAGAAHRRLGRRLSAGDSAAAAALRHLLQLLAAAGRLHPQHGRLRVRLDRLLGNLLGDQFRPARGHGRSPI